MEGAGGAQGHRSVAGRERAHVPRELARRDDAGRRADLRRSERRQARPPSRAECGPGGHGQAGANHPCGDGGDQQPLPRDAGQAAG